MGTGQVTDLKCHEEANVVTDWIRKKSRTRLRPVVWQLGRF